MKYYRQLLDIKNFLSLTKFEIQMMVNYAMHNSPDKFSLWAGNLGLFLNGYNDKKM